MRSDATSRRPPPPVPVTILTGFLGAGKTSLLNKLLRDPALADAVVLINEFGEIGLDHLFVEKIDGDMVMMSSGCICCTIRGDLVDSLENLLRRRDNGKIRDFSRLIIETTGLADPAPVLHTIMSHPYLLLRFRLDGVVTVIDAINGLETLEKFPEAVRQAAVADRLAVSKTDLVKTAAERQAFDQLAAKLRLINPTARVLLGGDQFDIGALLNVGLHDPASKGPDVARWLNAEKLIGDGHVGAHAHDRDHGDAGRHDTSIRTFCLVSEAPLPPTACELFLEMLRSAHGPDLLRVKGIIALADDLDRPLVIHGVQHVFHPPVRLDAWPDPDRRSRIVFITRNIDPEFVTGLYAAFAGEIRSGTPDAQALTANPLSLRSKGLLS